MSKLYDENNKNSILKYARRLEGKTLREVLPDEEIDEIIEGHPNNKGRFGHKIEQYYFKYAINSNANADFPCGIELKATPLKYLKNGNLTPKERLVCNIISYMNIADEEWETSSFLEKNSDILIIRYIDPMDKNVHQLDYKIHSVDIHNVLDNPDDAKQFEEDWEIITGKIRDGKAETLSESDTKWLGACTKGATAAKSFRQQPFSDILAKQRAFSFKMQYMRELLNRV